MRKIDVYIPKTEPLLVIIAHKQKWPEVIRYAGNKTKVMESK